MAGAIENEAISASVEVEVEIEAELSNKGDSKNCCFIQTML